MTSTDELFSEKSLVSEFVSYSGLTIFCHLFFYLLGWGLIRGKWNEFNESLQTANILDARAVAGIALWFIGVASSSFTLIRALSLAATVVRAKNITSLKAPARAILFILAAFAGCLAFTIHSWFNYIAPSDVFSTVVTVDNLWQFLGGFTFMIYILLSAFCFYTVIRLIRPYQKEILPEYLQDGLKTFFFLGFLGAVLGATAVLSPVWSYSFQSYSSFVSPYSLVNHIWRFGPDTPTRSPFIVVKLYLDVCIYFGLLGGIVLVGAIATRLPPLRRVLHGRIGDYLPNLPYPENFSQKFCALRSPPSFIKPIESLRIIFDYSIGELFVTSSIMGLYGWWFYFWSTDYARIRQEVTSYNDEYPNLHIYARVLGHMLTLTMSLMLYPASRNSVLTSAFGIPFERLLKHHRALGRLCWFLVTLHMALFQIKWAMEGTLWSNVFKVSGLEVTKCERQGTPCVVTENGMVTISSAFHADNFTVPLVETSWLLLTLVLVAAQFGRRNNYDMFHFLHTFTIIFYLAALVHSWTHWYYTVAGLVCYFCDKLVRASSGSIPASVVELSSTGEIVRLTVSCPVIPKPGQYLYLYMPSVSPFPHPFSLSTLPLPSKGYQVTKNAKFPPADSVQALYSKPGDYTYSFHIKVLPDRKDGSESFTGGLHRLARLGNDSTLLPVSLEGPYGYDYSGYLDDSVDTIACFAGGIGVTPFIALVEQLRAVRRIGAVRKLHLLWAVKSENELSVFADALSPLCVSYQKQLGNGALNGSDVEFDIQLYVTRAGTMKDRHTHSSVSSEDTEFGGNDPRRSLLNRSERQSADSATDEISPVHLGWTSPDAVRTLLSHTTYGRPDIQEAFESIVRARLTRLGVSGRKGNRGLLTMVCGPETMLQQVSSLSHEHKTTFHSEVFHF